MKNIVILAVLVVGFMPVLTFAAIVAEHPSDYVRVLDFFYKITLRGTLSQFQTSEFLQNSFFFFNEWHRLGY